MGPWFAIMEILSSEKQLGAVPTDFRRELPDLETKKSVPSGSGPLDVTSLVQMILHHGGFRYHGNRGRLS